MGSAAPGTSGRGRRWAQVAGGEQRSDQLEIGDRETTTATASSYIDECHDPKCVLHVGVLVGRVALIYVVRHDRAVSQHVSEMMYGFAGILCVIPAARLREEGIRNQRAHQGSEPDEKMESLQKCRKPQAKGTAGFIVAQEWLLTISAIPENIPVK